MGHQPDNDSAAFLFLLPRRRLGNGKRGRRNGIRVVLGVVPAAAGASLGTVFDRQQCRRVFFRVTGIFWNAHPVALACSAGVGK